jgi:hypothetical protein
MFAQFGLLSTSSKQVTNLTMSKEPTAESLVVGPSYADTIFRRTWTTFQMEISLPTSREMVQDGHLRLWATTPKIQEGLAK